ncbi:1,4-alpha-glucan branching enzyme [Streptomyces halstedii]|uniref:1,4-alpha-glucan branching enzyme n=1 Tax=Streptomyces halstedii TaxID=1944 RepID=UPI003461155A
MTARKPSRRTPAPAPEPVVVPPSAQPVTTEITKDAAATRSTEAAAPASDTPPPVKRARTKRDTTATPATAAGAKPAGAKGGAAETKAASPKPVRTKAVRAKATEATAVRTDVAGTESARAEAAADAGSTGTGSTGTGSTGARSTGAGSSRAEAPAPLQAANVSEAAGSGPGGDGPVPGAAASTPGAASAVDRAPSPADATANGAPPRPRRGGGSKDALPATALDDADRWRLLAGEHHAPHDVLGAHPASGGVAVRVLRPFAHAVTVLTEGLRAELQSDGDGLFSGVLPMPEVPDAYRLLITYDDGESEAEDPYRFLPTLGELDLHLIGEGRHEELWKALGAQPMERQGVAGTRFTVWAPDARGVRVAGDFNFWDGTGFPMRSLGSTGVWELFLPGVGEGARYKYDICRPDGSHTLRADPMARQAEVPPATASVVTASHHVWQDADWMAHRGDRPVHEAPFSVYEVHLPSWRPGLGYRQLATQLPAYVSELGFTHVELMPVSEHPFGGSWGYQVTGFYAPTSRLGSPDDFRFLVDSLHAAGIGVLMDWVPAHFPRDEWALAEFDGRPLYEHPDPSRAAHPDWGTLEFDYGRTEVRNFLVANATYWCEEFHIDGLRVDAVASMLYLDYSREDGQWSPNEFGGRENLDAVAFLQEMNATVYRRNPGVVTIAEESTAWDGVTRPTDQGGLGFGLKWNMGWMHDSLVYVSKEPIHRKYHHHEMTFSMVYAYSENYVLPISHDEVVHGKQALVSKMPGDWWQRRANHRAYLGFMWAHPGKQLLFMGQEFAQGAEWSEGHGPDWWLLDETYEASGDHRGVRSLVTDLNGVYNALPALWQRDTDPGGFSWIDGGAAEDNAFSFVRYDADGSPLIAVSHFSPVVRHDYRIGVPDGAEAWVEVLNTDAARYGGGDIRNEEPLKPEVVPAHGRDTSIALTLPPLATVWLRPA